MHVHGGQQTSRVLRLSLLATFIYIALTVVAGIKANSLALLSEAGHNVSDFFALLLSWVAVYIQTRPPNAKKTYGYQRAGVLAAFINAISLILISFYICYEAIERLYNPQPVEPGMMMLVAGVGVIMNAGITVALWRSSRDVNIRSALLHEIGDTLSTAAVIVGGFGILKTGQGWIDPVLSFGISAMIIWSSYGIIRETLNILLEGAPLGISADQVAETIRGIDGVNEVHDLHIWSLGSESHALSCHIGIADIPPSVSERILREVQQALRERYRIHHTTIQFEHIVCDIAHGCVVVTDDEHGHAHGHGHQHAH